MDVTVQFSQNAASPKSITVNTIIENIPLNAIFPLTPDSVGQQSKSVFIDLAANNVPRFTDNQVFDVTATASEAGTVIGTATKTGAEIPLPVVHVHGILTDCTTADRIPRKLFGALSKSHPTYNEDDGETLSSVYPTLVSFDYQSLQRPATAIAADLGNWIQRELTSPQTGKTYAAKVNVVAHSLGGIITRAAISYNSGATFINKVILVGSPSEGAAFAEAVVSYWPAANLLFPLINVGSFLGAPGLLGILSCVQGGTLDTTKVLLPTYPWYAASASSQPVASGSNPELLAINGFGLNPNIRYYGIVASGVDTLTTLYGRSVLWLGQMRSQTGIGPGDGTVPIQSQRAAELGWSGTGPGRLNVYLELRDKTVHTQYFESDLVNSAIDAILWRVQ